MAKRNLKKTKAKAKPQKAARPAPKLTHTVTAVTELPGKKDEGGYGSRYKDASASVEIIDTRVKFSVACQTVTVEKRDLIKLGIGLFEVDDVLKKLPKLDGVNWTTILALEIPTVGGPKMKVVKGNRDGATWVVFENINGNRYKFKCRAETFKELLGILSKEYKVVEVTQ